MLEAALSFYLGETKSVSRRSSALSPAVEDYLKSVYETQRDEGRAVTTLLAERMGVTPASATGMVKKLAALKLVRHVPYQGVVLTRAGQKIALEVLRHHRLVELYLAEALGYSWDRVHEEADRLEHVISEELEDRMFEALGRPTRDPHGEPIPTRGRDAAAGEPRAAVEPGGRRGRDDQRGVDGAARRCCGTSASAGSCRTRSWRSSRRRLSTAPSRCGRAGLHTCWGESWRGTFAWRSGRKPTA